MSNLIYILSIIIASIWFIAYFMWDAAPIMIHSLIVMSFFGILASILLEEKSETTIYINNQNK